MGCARPHWLPCVVVALACMLCAQASRGDAVGPSASWLLDAGAQAPDGGLADVTGMRGGVRGDAVTRGTANVSHRLAATVKSHPVRVPVPGRLARVILGLCALVALAIAAGHPRVDAFEKRAGLSMFASTAVPFLALGAIMRLPQVGIIDDGVVQSLRPLMEFGLGWIGIRVGSEFNFRELGRLPGGAGRLAVMQSAGAFAAASVGTIATLWLVGRSLGSDLIRDGLILGACASVSAPSGARALEAVGAITAQGARLVRKIVQLDDVVPIAVLALVTAIFRPALAGQWNLPPLGWVFVQIGMGTALGALTVGLLRAARNVNEEVALLLGAVAFASGMASYVGFSPLTIGCVGGVVVTNVTTGDENAGFIAELRGLERPIFMVFFAAAGSLWEVHDWRGWVVIPLFVIARLLGKIGGVQLGLLGEHATPAHESIQAPAGVDVADPVSLLGAFPDVRRLDVALIPTSAVSIAVVISATQSYRDIPRWLEGVAIVGAIAAELVFQGFLFVAHRRSPRPRPAGPSDAGQGAR